MSTTPPPKPIEEITVENTESPKQKATESSTS
jgi:hypothetical protein